jgi:hypothetical protein
MALFAERMSLGADIPFITTHAQRIEQCVQVLKGLAAAQECIDRALGLSTSLTTSVHNALRAQRAAVAERIVHVVNTLLGLTNPGQF